MSDVWVPGMIQSDNEIIYQLKMNNVALCQQVKVLQQQVWDERGKTLEDVRLRGWHVVHGDWCRESGKGEK